MTAVTLTTTLDNLLKIPCSEHRDEVLKAAAASSESDRRLAILRIEDYLTQRTGSVDRPVAETLVGLRQVRV